MIDEIKNALETAIPGVQVRQLQASLASDDDGVWIVTHPKSRVEVNLETHNGQLPILIENSLDDNRVTATTIAESTAAISHALGLDF